MDPSANLATPSAPSQRLSAQEWLYRQLKRLRLLLFTRPRALLGAGVFSGAISAALLMWLTETHSFKETLQRLLLGPQFSPAGWSFLSAFLLSPVAFVLWKFRDTNQLWLIENQRKDINLKKFQKLCEWASGSALVEDEVTSGSDGIESIKSSKLPEQSALYSATRRQGSEALQIASIQQLGSYLLGENGEQFQRPALEMLFALWQSLTQGVRWALTDEHKDFDKWFAEIAYIQRSLLCRSLSYALLANENRALLMLSQFLPRQVLIGLNTDLPGISPLKLRNCKLDGIDLQGGKLERAVLQGSSFIGAQLRGIWLNLAQLQGANMSNATLDRARLCDAQLEGAILQHVSGTHAFFMRAKLQHTDWRMARLNFTNLASCDLKGAYLIGTAMRRTQFSDSNLRSASIINPDVNADTCFANASTDEFTSVGVVSDIDQPYPMRSWVPLLTHALRLKLKSDNGLVLPERAYEEFAGSWAQIDKSKQDNILENIYKYSANPGAFSLE